MSDTISEPTDEHNHERESFRFLNRAWDITAARNLIKNGTGQQRTIRVADWARLLELIAVDPARAEAVDLDQPVIIVPMPDTGGPMVGPMVIDGWHRIYRAHRDGRERLNAVMLPADTEPSIRLEPTIRLSSQPIGRSSRGSNALSK